MRRFQFLANPTMFDDPDAFVAHIGSVEGKKELCHQLSQKLHFPLLVNSHWDALLDFLCDFNWIEQYKVILIHDDLVQLNIHDFHTYLEILLESINMRKEGEDHEFNVIFPSEYEDLIRPYEEKYLIELEEFLKRESQ